MRKFFLANINVDGSGAVVAGTIIHCNTLTTATVKTKKLTVCLPPKLRITTPPAVPTITTGRGTAP